MKTITRRRSLPFATDDADLIYHVGRGLLDENVGACQVRLVGVSVSGLLETPGIPQEPMFDEESRKHGSVATADAIRDRFGEDAITRAAILSLGRRKHPSFSLPSFFPPER